MRSLILSQCRDLRIGVTREDLGALTTVRARQCRHFVLAPIQCLSIALPSSVQAETIGQVIISSSCQLSCCSRVDYLPVRVQ